MTRAYIGTALAAFLAAAPALSPPAATDEHKQKLRDPSGQTFDVVRPPPGRGAGILYSSELGVPPVYYLGDSGRIYSVVPSFLPPAELARFQRDKPQIIRRKLRRAAYRRAGKPWPVCGGGDPS